MQRQFPDDLVTARGAPADFPASSDAIPSCKLTDYRTRFAVCREEPPEPRTLEMPKPAGEGGP